MTVPPAPPISPDDGEDPGAAFGGVPVEVPDEVGLLPPGPMLAEALDGLPVDRVNGFGTVTVLQAAYRQLAYQQAVFFEALVETGLRARGSAATVRRVQVPDEFSCEEARAALVWSRTRAGSMYALAHALCVRLPELGLAMRRGELDLPRAKAFIDWTDGLTDVQAAQVCDHLIPQAAGLTVGELIDQIKRACLAIDPDWAERKYANAVRQRKVAGYRNPDGTATLGGYNQPLDRVAAACARIDTLARACKRAGDGRKIDHIRSDLFLGMIDGTFEQMSDQQIINHVLAHPYVDPANTDDSGDGDGSGGRPNRRGPAPGGNGRGGTPGPAGQADTPSSDGGNSDDGGGSSSSDSDDSDVSGDGSDDSDDGGNGHSGDGSGNDSSRDGRSEPVPEEPVAAKHNDPGAPVASHGWAAPEVRIGLSTVLGLDEQPGHIPGWGPIPAPLARHLVSDMQHAEWRWVVCDPGTGHAIAGGLLTARPSGRGRVRRDTRRGIVELAVTTTELHQLTEAGRHRTWAPVLEAIAAAYRRWRRDETSSGGSGRHGQAHRRLPGARLRRWIQLRDRRCSYPGCRAPAAANDVDHRVDYAAGGPTSPENLHPPCRHDHRVKHDGGWQIHAAPDGATVWVSPLGHRHTSRPSPVIPPPLLPMPRHLDSDWDPLDDAAWLGGSWQSECDCALQPCPHADAEESPSYNADDTSQAAASDTGGNHTGDNHTGGNRAGGNFAGYSCEPPAFDDEPPPF